MSRTYEIRYLPAAQQDLLDIFEYIRRDDPDAAEALLAQFDRTIANLTDHPLIGIIPKDERLQRLGYRMLVVSRYLIFYVVKKDVVQIRRVIHGSRNYTLLL
ncbi:MAG: type II toxin-antitoxin system RelE/ParE family toxin [Caldilineaceae bacterium]